MELPCPLDIPKSLPVLNVPLFWWAEKSAVILLHDRAGALKGAARSAEYN